MKEGIQSRIKNPAIKEYGCYFLCILRWAEIKTGKELTEDDVETLYQKALKKGFIQADCFVVAPTEVYGLVNQDMVCYIAKTYNRPTFGSYIICNKKPMYTHFVLCVDNVIWDPLDPARPGAAGYKPDSYRVLG